MKKNGKAFFKVANDDGLRLNKILLNIKTKI